MKNTLQIGEVIYDQLKQFGNVFPLIADEGTRFPFIIYKRASGYSNNSKDGHFSIIANIDVVIAAQSYEESIELADNVLSKLESANGLIAGYDVWSIRMIDSNELWSDNTFIQTLKFRVEFSIPVEEPPTDDKFLIDDMEFSKNESSTIEEIKISI